MLNIGDLLYKKLPEIYRTRDANIRPVPFPLKRFLRILGDGGFDEIERYINDMNSMYDIDNCDPVFLEHIADTMGLKFPFDMDEHTQRRFLKVMPKIYKVKGTPQSFNYLAREMFGNHTEIKTRKQQYEEGMTPEEYRKLFVNIKIDGDTNHLHDKERNFRKFCELLRPINTRLVVNLILFYFDHYNSIDRVKCEYGRENISFNPDIEFYGEKLLVDGVDHFEHNSGLFLEADLNRAFRLNSSKLYGGQKITHIKRLKDEMALDLLRRTDGQDIFNIHRVNDFVDNFTLNGSHIFGTGKHIGYNGDKTIITLREPEDLFSRQLKDIIASESLIAPVVEDKLIKKKYYVDGKKVEGTGIFLRADVNNPFAINKSHLYSSQDVEVKDRFVDEALSPIIKENLGEDVKLKKACDFSDQPFHLNATRLNKSSAGLVPTENLDKLVVLPIEDSANLSMTDKEVHQHLAEPVSAESYTMTKEETASSKITVTVTPSLLCGMTKLVSSFHLTHFVPQKPNFAY